MALADVQDLVADLSGGIVGEDPAARDRAIALAVERYGRDRPRRVVVDATSATGAQLDVPAGADPDLPIALEHPVGESPPRMLERAAFSLYRSPSGPVILLHPPLAAGAAVRIHAGGPHALDPATDTVPPADRLAVACYAASVLLDGAAARTAGDTSPTIRADSVEQRATSSNYRSQAKSLRSRYFALLGIDEERGLPPASAAAQLATAGSWGGARMQRPRRRP